MEISYSKDSGNSIVKNKQLSDSKIKGLFVTSAIKFVTTFATLSLGHLEHYPSKVNHVTFSRDWLFF